MIKGNMDETKSGYSAHVGGLMGKKLDDSNYEYHCEVKEIHLNTSKMAHGGFLMFVADTGMGNAAHQVSGNKRCVTISLEMKFVTAASLGQKLLTKVKIQRKTNTLVFITSEIISSENIIATASGVWKILKS
jgi:acyl-coenzyme A thioesterase PaaI-like protein|tara:strand:- start:261 stop:656 length:396 start_codon:yes stop_codon:yes gene_type:complete